MVHEKMALFREFRMKRKYEILLVSFLILIFGGVFFPAEIDPMPFLVFQNVLASTILFYGKKKWQISLYFLLVFLVILELINQFTTFTNSRILFTTSYIIYFIFLSTEVFRQILTTKDVDIGMIAAVLCGFIILGMAGGSVFTVIEIIHPDSFNNLSQGLDGISDLMYYSFITILTIGYGDITPATNIAQKMSMFFGLIGYFYGVVVIGIIMGKYLSKDSSGGEK